MVVVVFIVWARVVVDGDDDDDDADVDVGNCDKEVDEELNEDDAVA